MATLSSIRRLDWGSTTEFGAAFRGARVADSGFVSQRRALEKRDPTDALLRSPRIEPIHGSMNEKAIVINCTLFGSVLTGDRRPVTDGVILREILVIIGA